MLSRVKSQHFSRKTSLLSQAGVTACCIEMDFKTELRCGRFARLLGHAAVLDTGCLQPPKVF